MTVQGNEPPIISVQGLIKEFSAVRALDGVDLDVHVGCVPETLL